MSFLRRPFPWFQLLNTGGSKTLSGFQRVPTSCPRNSTQEQQSKGRNEKRTNGWPHVTILVLMEYEIEEECTQSFWSENLKTQAQIGGKYCIWSERNTMDVDWIQLAHVTDQWRSLANKVIYLQLLSNAWNVLPSWEAFSQLLKNSAPESSCQCNDDTDL
jgi:hypothetical protein